MYIYRLRIQPSCNSVAMAMTLPILYTHTHRGYIAYQISGLSAQCQPYDNADTCTFSAGKNSALLETLIGKLAAVTPIHSVQSDSPLGCLWWRP